MKFLVKTFLKHLPSGWREVQDDLLLRYLLLFSSNIKRFGIEQKTLNLTISLSLFVCFFLCGYIGYIPPVTENVVSKTRFNALILKHKMRGIANPQTLN